MFGIMQSKTLPDLKERNSERRLMHKKRINSKRKGAEGERELAKKLQEYGYDCRRGQQYCGANGDADVVGLPGIHIECKRVQNLNIYNAIAQAKHDALPFDTVLPAVFHRKNNCEWLVYMTLEDWILIYREWTNGR